MQHRHKVNVLDVNIGKCKDLIQRLEATSFGKLGKNIDIHTSKNNKDPYLEKPEYTKNESKLVLTEQIQDPYKRKYIDVKERFEQLQEDYNELKLAVEKLISKGEM